MHEEVTSGPNKMVDKTSVDETSMVKLVLVTFSKAILLSVLETTTVYNTEKNW